MTDIEKFIELYKSFGIELVQEKDPTNNNFYLSLTEGDHEKLDGYACFGSLIFFDENGKFIKQSFIE